MATSKSDLDFIWIVKTIKHISNANNGSAFEYLFDDVLTLEGAPTVKSIHEGAIRQLEAMGVVEIQEIGNALHDGVFKLDGFKIQILKAKFDELYNPPTNESVSENSISFDEESSILQFDGTPIKIKKYSKEFYFCNVMFAHSKGELVSWDEIHEEMTQEVPADIERNTKAIMDTMYALNNHIKEKTQSSKILFSRNNNMIQRHF